MTISLAILLLASTATLPRAAQAPEEGALAPAGCWTTDGGAPSRSGLSLTAPLRGEPAEAWSYETRGTIESEPLVWGETVVLSVRETPYKRALHVLGAPDGRQRSTTAIPAEVPLQPSLWEDVLAIRPALERIELLRVTPRRLQPLRTVRASHASGPLLYQNELYYTDDAEIVRLDVDARDPIWRKRVQGSFRGRPALRGGHVFAVWYDERGTAHLACIERETGKLRSDVVFGHHAGAIPEREAPLELTVLEQEVFVRLPLPIATGNGRTYTTVRIGREGSRLGDAAGGSSVHEFRCPPTGWRQGWIVLDATGRDEERWLASYTEGVSTRSIVLSEAGNHPRLLESRAPLALADDVFYLDDMAVDAEEFHILWKSGLRPRLRPVPLEEAVLLVTEEDRVVSLRTPYDRRSPAADEAARLVRRLEAELGDGIAALVLRAVRIEARELAEGFLDEATARGANNRSIQRAGEALATPARRLRPNARAEEALRAERDGLVQAFHEKLLYHARRTGDRDLARTLLAELVAQVPSSREVRDAVRALLPEDAPVTEPFDATSWLQFLEVHRDTPVSFVAPAPSPAANEGQGEEILRREVEGWRRDLYGYRTDRLFIVTPPSRPGAVARCLEVGELVCNALEDLFGQAAAPDADQLVLLLYGTDEEYHEQSQREGSRPELARGWSGGHYSPEERISRMYVPDERASERLLGVYAHELTHHWLATRSPFAARGWRARASQGGYWIAEGFATMVEEFRFLPGQGRWDWNDPQAESLDVVANARPDQLMPWSDFFALSQEAFHELDDARNIQIPLSWRLGAQGRVSRIRLFYAQAGAASHYLLRAEDGRHRPALLRLIEDWTLGRAKDVERTFDLDPDELGRRIVAFARETTRQS